MKRSTLVILVLLTMAVVGCSIGGGDEAAAEKPTAMPTYTPYPTYTPFPTPTTPPEPTDAPEATETPEPAETEEAATATPALPQVTLAFASNLREGPSTQFDTITRLPAGEVLLVLGRNLIGDWLLVQTFSGTEGWMKITQLQQPVNVAQFSLAEGIPTLDPDLVTPTEPSEEATEAPESEIPMTDDDFLLATTAGDIPVCRTYTWSTVGAFPPETANGGYPPFNYANPETVINATPKYRFNVTGDLPSDVDFTIDGNVTGADCSGEACTMATFTVCARAESWADTGGFVYKTTLFIEVGDQAYSNFYQMAYLTMPLHVTVSPWGE